MLMASQDIDSRAEKLLENVGYRMVLRANTAASAAAAGVPAAVNRFCSRDETVLLPAPENPVTQTTRPGVVDAVWRFVVTGSIVLPSWGRFWVIL